VLEPAERAVALDVARDVVARLGHRGRVEEAAEAAAGQTGFPETVRWTDHSIAQGYAGLALAAAYVDACFPDAGWDVVGHEYLIPAARGAERVHGLSAGLYDGLAGLALAAWTLSHGGVRYRRLLSALDETLLPMSVGLASALAADGDGLPFHDFDVISGVSGVGAYLLSRAESDEPAAALRAVLLSLVALTEPDDGLPRWRTPAEALPATSWGDHYPYGNLNCGLAHGIPGPLALMALALRAGVVVDGLREAIDRTAGWLGHKRSDDEWGANWPSAIPLGEDGRPHGPGEPSRSAWCYGSPGVARALWLAGEALEDDAYRALAVEAMEAVYRRPIPVRAIDSPTFCHGIAGLLQITLRFANDTRLPVFRDAAAALTEQLVGLYEPESALGFRSHEPGGRLIDQPGLLDGAPGVALVLLAAATSVEPTWDRLFLLS
jgi:hypothetical protein